MTDFNQFHDSFSNVPAPTKKMPDMINVLTILTFIGCAYFLLSGIYSYFTICKSIGIIDGSMGQIGANNPMAGFMDSAIQMVHRQCEMKLPLLLINLVTTALCFIGAMQMRQLKKAGFFIYLVGEVAGPVAQTFILGSGTIGIFMILGFIFPLVFIILYATQLKHLK